MGEEIYRKQSRSVITKFSDWLKKRSLKQLVITAFVLIVVIWVAERLINAGTFFGYQVVNEDSEATVLGNEQVETLACTRLTPEEVGDVLGANATRIGGVFPDREEPNFVSSCSYKVGTEQVRSVSLLVRDEKNEKVAQSMYENLKNRNTYEELSNFGDQSIFTPVSRQLNVITKNRIVSVTVSDPTNTSSIANKDAVIELYKKFNN